MASPKHVLAKTTFLNSPHASTNEYTVNTFGSKPFGIPFLTLKYVCCKNNPYT